MAVVREIDPAGDRAKGVAEQMRAAVEHQIDQLGRHLAGFAIVAWDMRGDFVSAYQTAHGPVSPNMMPELVRAQLETNRAAMAAANSQAREIPPPGGDDAA